MATDMATISIGAADVKALRESLGWTQGDLADHLGVTRTLVTHWESGLRTPNGPAAILLADLHFRHGPKESRKKSRSAIARRNVTG